MKSAFTGITTKIESTNFLYFQKFLEGKRKQEKYSKLTKFVLMVFNILPLLSVRSPSKQYSFLMQS